MSRFKPNNSVLEKRPMPRPRPASAPVVASEAGVAVADDNVGVTEEVSAGGANKIALYLSVAFIFLRFSFLHEMLMSKIGFDSHLLLVVGGSAVLAALISGGLFNGISNKITVAWLAFAVCMVFATGTSIWKGGSFAVLFPYLRTTMILVIMIPAVATSTKSLSLVLKTIGYAGLVTILLGLTVNDYRAGRLELAGAGASIENSNDYAALLILVMPAIAYATMRRGTWVVFKVIGPIALVMSCFLVLSTGSRGALISMVISALYVLKAGSGKIRIALLLCIPLAAVIAIPFLPGEASQRLGSLLNSQNQTEEAAASRDERAALLMASLRITLQHPLLGVGPGTFEEYQAQDAKDKGQRGMWHETHNSYTQVSSECGIPALIFYVSAIFMSFLIFRKGRKSPDPDIRSVSSIFGLMLVSFCVCMFFLSQAYGFGFPVLGGLAISLDRLMGKNGHSLS